MSGALQQDPSAERAGALTEHGRRDPREVKTGEEQPRGERIPVALSLVEALFDRLVNLG